MKKYESYYTQGVLSNAASNESSGSSAGGGGAKTRPARPYLSTKTEPLLDLIKSLDLDDDDKGERKTPTTPIAPNSSRYNHHHPGTTASNYDMKSLDDSTNEAINAVLMSSEADYQQPTTTTTTNANHQQQSSSVSCLCLSYFRSLKT